MMMDIDDINDEKKGVHKYGIEAYISKRGEKSMIFVAPGVPPRVPGPRHPPYLNNPLSRPPDS